MTSFTSSTSPPRPAALRKQRHSPIAEHPHPDIRQTEMIALQFRERLNRWLLEHLLQLRGRTPAADKDTMILRHRSIEPEADVVCYGLWLDASVAKHRARGRNTRHPPQEQAATAVWP